MGLFDKILNAFREKDEDVNDDPVVDTEMDNPTLQFRNIDLSKIEVDATEPTNIQVDTIESQTGVAPEKFEMPTIKSEPEVVADEPAPKPVKPVQPAKPVAVPTSSPNYEFIRVISPTTGLKDVDMEEPPRRVVTAKTTSAMSSIGTILSPTLGNFAERELQGEEAEEWKQLRVDDFLDDVDTETEAQAQEAADDIIETVEPKEEPVEVKTAPKEEYERLIILPTMFEVEKKKEEPVVEEPVVTEKKATVKEPVVKEPEKTIVNLSLFDDDYQ